MKIFTAFLTSRCLQTATVAFLCCWTAKKVWQQPNTIRGSTKITSASAVATAPFLKENAADETTTSTLTHGMDNHSELVASQCPGGIIVPIPSSVSVRSGCDSNIVNTVKTAADAGLATALWWTLATPGPGAIAAISVGLFKLVIDLACESAGKPSVPALLAEDVRIISREVAKGVVLSTLAVKLTTLSRNIQNYNNSNGIPIQKMLDFAEEANSIETQVSSLGIVGIHVATAAATLKFQLLAVLKDYSRNNEAYDEQCCARASIFFADYLDQSKSNFQSIRDDFNAYKLTEVITYKSNSCGCFLCGDITQFFCCPPYHAKLIARNGLPVFVTNCIYTSEYVAGRDGLTLKNIWFDDMEAKLWTREVFAMERKVSSLAGKSFTSCSPYRL